MSKAIGKVAASLNLIIGVAWTFEIAFFFLTMAGISTPISSRAVFISATVWFIGPVFLVAGSLMILLGKLPTISLTISILAALVLNGIVGDMVYDAFHPQPLQGPPPYKFYAVAIILTVLCDLCMVWLVADWKQNRWKFGVNTSGA